MSKPASLPQALEPLSNEQVTALAAHHGVMTVDFFDLPQGRRNYTYGVADHNGAKFVLTELIAHDSIAATAIAETVAHVGAVSDLSTGIVRGRSGASVSSGPRSACMLAPFADGARLDSLHKHAPELIGRTLASIHRLAAPPHLQHRRRRLRKRLDEEWIDGAGFAPSLLHGDPFSDNFFLSPVGQVIAIDWEYAAVDHPLIDLGIAAYGLLLGGLSRDGPERLRRSYEEVIGQAIDCRLFRRALAFGAALIEEGRAEAAAS